jgi:hypothetical protein
VRASYHVGSMVPSRQVHSDLASAMAALNADKLLLDDYLAGGSRRRARIAAATAGPSSLAGAGAAGAVQTIAEDAAEGTAEQQAIQQLQVRSIMMAHNCSTLYCPIPPLIIRAPVLHAGDS